MAVLIIIGHKECPHCVELDKNWKDWKLSEELSRKGITVIKIMLKNRSQRLSNVLDKTGNQKYPKSVSKIQKWSPLIMLFSDSVWSRLNLDKEKSVISPDEISLFNGYLLETGVGQFQKEIDPKTQDYYTITKKTSIINWVNSHY